MTVYDVCWNILSSTKVLLLWLLLLFIIFSVINDKPPRWNFNILPPTLFIYPFFSSPLVIRIQMVPIPFSSGPHHLRATLGLISSILFSLSLFSPLSSTYKQTRVSPFLKKNPSNYSSLQLLTSCHSQTSKRLVSVGHLYFFTSPSETHWIVTCPFIILLRQFWLVMPMRPVLIKGTNTSKSSSPSISQLYRVLPFTPSSWSTLLPWLP